MTFRTVFRSLKYQCTDSIQNKQKQKKRANKKRAFHQFHVRSRTEHTKSTRDFARQNLDKTAFIVRHIVFIQTQELYIQFLLEFTFRVASHLRISYTQVHARKRDY